MYATLKENCTHEGFTPGKEYKYFDNYEIESGKVLFYFVANDEGKKVKMNEREFRTHFRGHYADVPYIK